MSLPPGLVESILQQQNPTSPGAAASMPFPGGQPQMQPAVGGVLPPTNPVDASAGQPQPTGTPQGAVAPQPAAGPMSNADPLMQLYQQSIGRGQQALQNLRGLGQRESQVPTATAAHPHIEQGAGFFHNLGQAMMMLGLATKHGQALQSAMARGPQEQRAQEIAGIQAQEKPEEEAVRFEGQTAAGAGGLAYKEGMLGVRQQQADTAEERAQAYTTHIQDQAKNYLANVNLRQAGLNERTRADFAKELQAKADEMGRDYRALHHDATNVEVAGIVTNAKETLANEAALRDPSIGGWLKNLIGIEAPQIQGAASPAMGGPAQPSGATGAPSTPRASKAATATPARPKGVPEGAKWNPQTRRWSM